MSAASPWATFTYTVSGTDVSFDASGSRGVDSYYWTFDYTAHAAALGLPHLYPDNYSATGESPSHDYGSNGHYHVVLMGLDSSTGAVACCGKHVHIPHDSDDDAEFDSTLTYTGHSKPWKFAVTETLGANVTHWTWAKQYPKNYSSPSYSPGPYAEPDRCTFYCRATYRLGQKLKNYVVEHSLSYGTGEDEGPPGTGYPIQGIDVSKAGVTATLSGIRDAYRHMHRPVDGGSQTHPYVDIDWGDGTIDTKQVDLEGGPTYTYLVPKTLSHTYSGYGSYGIKLRAFWEDGGFAVGTGPMWLHTVDLAGPHAGDLYFRDDMDQLDGTFRSSVSDAYDYRWNFGDGHDTGWGSTREVSHSYAVSGTYDVTMHVKLDAVSSYSVTQSVIATSKRVPADIVDAMRLEILVPPESGPSLNLCENPDGALGSYGWLAPTDGCFVTGTTTTIDGIPGAKLLLNVGDVSTAAHFTTTNAALGEFDTYVAAVWTAPSAHGYYRAEFEFLDSGGSVVRTAGRTGYLSGSLAEKSIAATATHGDAYVRLRFDLYSDKQGSDPDAAAAVMLRGVYIASANSTGALSGLTYSADANWVDVMDDADDIRIERHALDVGTLRATVWSEDLTDDLSVGTPVRLRVATTVEKETVWTPIFTGSLIQPAYSLHNFGEGFQVRVALQAADNVRTLAHTPESRSVAVLGQLSDLMTGAHVPWSINGGTHFETAVVVAKNADASLLDQIVLTRDTAGGYAWVDSANTLQVYSKDETPSMVIRDIDERRYDAVDIAFDTDELINDVSIEWLRLEGDDTRTVTYGPYVDSASISDWGRHHESFKMVGDEDKSDVSDIADAILSRNSTPHIRVKSMQVPIWRVDQVPMALLDLYDLIGANYKNATYNADRRITSIQHDISRDGGWRMTIDVTEDTSVAAARVTPRPADDPDTIPTFAKLMVTGTLDMQHQGSIIGATRITTDKIQGTGSGLEFPYGFDIAGTHVSGIDFGYATPSIDANAEAKISHGLGKTPVAVFLQQDGGSPHQFVRVLLAKKSPAYFTVKAFDNATGKKTPNNDVNFFWLAIA